jgi:hypothetical protein
MTSECILLTHSAALNPRFLFHSVLLVQMSTPRKVSMITFPKLHGQTDIYSRNYMVKRTDSSNILRFQLGSCLGFVMTIKPMIHMTVITVCKSHAIAMRAGEETRCCVCLESLGTHTHTYTSLPDHGLGGVSMASRKCGSSISDWRVADIHLPIQYALHNRKVVLVPRSFGKHRHRMEPEIATSSRRGSQVTFI